MLFTLCDELEYYLSVNEISLVYYGNLCEIEQHLLYQLNVLKVYSVTQNRSGFYAIESNHGRESIKKLSLDLENIETEAVLIYRYLSNEELEIIKFNRQNIKYYILPHRLLDINYIQKSIVANISNSSIIADCSNSSSVQNYGYLKEIFSTKNILRISSINRQTDKNNKKNDSSRLPVVFLFLIKALINPVNELKRYYILIKYSNLRMLSRFIELLLFFDFIINAIIIKSFKLVSVYIYYKTNFLAGLLKVMLIRLGFGLRHILLMTGFKSFGFFIDSYYILVRIKKFVYSVYDRLFYFIYYRFIYFLYYKVFYFIYYNIFKAFFSFFYYKLFYFLYYRVGYYLYYQTRHFLLMSAFKTYGIVYDFCMLLYRFVKLVLMYPFFKIYWFSRYQYEKRIKKYYSHDI